MVYAPCPVLRMGNHMLDVTRYNIDRGDIGKFRAGQVAAGMAYDPTSARRLWCAVLRDQLFLAFSTRAQDTPADVQEARRWFGSPGFCEVCTLAGFDPEYVFDRFNDVRRGGM
jgi:hypothetical protein